MINERGHREIVEKVSGYQRAGGGEENISSLDLDIGQLERNVQSGNADDPQSQPGEGVENRMSVFLVLAKMSESFCQAARELSASKSSGRNQCDRRRINIAIVTSFRQREGSKASSITDKSSSVPYTPSRLRGELGNGGAYTSLPNNGGFMRSEARGGQLVKTQVYHENLRKRTSMKTKKDDAEPEKAEMNRLERQKFIQGRKKERSATDVPRR